MWRLCIPDLPKQGGLSSHTKHSLQPGKTNDGGGGEQTAALLEL